MTHIVVMGVSGCGKSTVGELLADRLGIPFLDADDLHPAQNLAKMARGIPLDDADRWPWLASVGRELAASPEGAVVACSALRRSCRDLLRAVVPALRFVHLVGTPEQLAARMHARERHFMPVSLLDTQLATLEPLGRREHGIELDCALDPRHAGPDRAAAAHGRTASAVRSGGGVPSADSMAWCTWTRPCRRRHSHGLPRVVPARVTGAAHGPARRAGARYRRLRSILAT